MLTGRAARGSTWRVLDEWVEPVVRRSREPARDAGRGAPQPRRRPAAKKTASQEDRRHEERPHEAGQEDGRPRSAAPRRRRRRPPRGRGDKASPDAIGVNPTRRYASRARAAPRPAEPARRPLASATCLHPTRPRPRRPPRLRLGLGGDGRVRHRARADAAALPDRHASASPRCGRLHRLPAEGLGRRAQPDRRPDQRPHRRPARPAAAVAAARRAGARRRRSRCSSPRPTWARRSLEAGVGAGLLPGLRDGVRVLPGAVRRRCPPR